MSINDTSIPRLYWQSRLRDATSLPRVISFYLAAEIVRLRLREGERFPRDEQELATQLKTSRQTINQAWKMLEADGVIQIRQGSGVIILNPKLLEPDPRTLTTLYEIRKQAEKLLARLAANRRSPEDLARMKSTLRKQDELTKHANELIRAGNKEPSDWTVVLLVLDYFSADVDFHEAVKSAANDTWVEIIDEIAGGKTCLKRVQSLEHLEYIPLSTQQHWEIYKAILNEQADKAEDMVEEHLGTAYKAAQGQELTKSSKKRKTH